MNKFKLRYLVLTILVLVGTYSSANQESLYQSQDSLATITLSEELCYKLFDIINAIPPSQQTQTMQTILTLLPEQTITLPQKLLVELFGDFYVYAQLITQKNGPENNTKLLDNLKQSLGSKQNKSAFFSSLLAQLLEVCGDVFIGGDLTVCGTISGATCCDNFIYSFDTTDHIPAAINTFENITLNTNGALDGWTHALGTATFTCNQTATYLITYDARIAYLDTMAPPFTTFRVTQNGIPITGSRHNLEVGFQATTLSKTFIVFLTTGDDLIFQWTTTDLAVRLQTFASPDTATTPSFSVSISRVN